MGEGLPRGWEPLGLNSVMVEFLRGAGPKVEETRWSRDKEWGTGARRRGVDPSHPVQGSGQGGSLGVPVGQRGEQRRGPVGPRLRRASGLSPNTIRGGVPPTQGREEKGRGRGCSRRATPWGRELPGGRGGWFPGGIRGILNWNACKAMGRQVPPRSQKRSTG